MALLGYAGFDKGRTPKADDSPVRPQYSRFRPRSYAIVFVTGDIVALGIQAAGGQ